MGKAFGIVLFVLALWVGMEVYTEGMQGAFGGALASFSGGDEAAEGEHRTAPQRAGDAVERAFAEGEERRNALIVDE